MYASIHISGPLAISSFDFIARVLMFAAVKQKNIQLPKRMCIA